jgi:hypothetical protein
MQILQFKVGGEYEYNVAFDTGSEKQKIQTNDNPTGDLLFAISSVVNAAIKYFRFESISAQFRSVTFSYPETSPDCFTLEFYIKTKENIYVKHLLKTDKITLNTDDATSSDTSYQLRIDQNNALVEKIIKLREEVALYAQGARAQSELPFEDGEEKTDSEDELFDDDEFDINEGNR